MEPNLRSFHGTPTREEALISSDGRYWRCAVRRSFNAMALLSFSSACLFCCAVSIGLSVGYASPEGIPSSGGLERRSAVHLETESNLKRRQIEFLNRIRKSDPQHRTIERALFNDRNELGLILNRSVELDKIPALMRTMLTQMAREFPGQDLTVLAYSPSNPPRKIGIARLNARTRDMTYKPEH